MSDPSVYAAPHFITVDAETAVIREGIATISAIRDKVEARQQLRIPIVWFVRFQRSVTEYLRIDSPEYFAGPFTTAFDGFELAKAELLQLSARGDEIGWHYHAYNYVHRTDLSHAHRMKILEADLVASAHQLHVRHPYHEIRSFRFGWFFAPSYEIFTTLEGLGIRADASIRAGRYGHRVASSEVEYLPPLTTTPKKVGGVFFFPYLRTLLTHDYEVVHHDFSWSKLDGEGARRSQEEFELALSRTVAEVKRSSASLTTYRAMVALLT